jgi:hypothetical protein
MPEIIKRTQEQQELYDLMLSYLRERFPEGCEKCQPRILKVLFSNSGTSPCFGFCSACLAKHAPQQQWAKDEIVRRFVKRHGVTS